MIVYALPAVPLAFLGLPLYVYLPAHYAALPGVGLAMVGMVLLLARLIDLVTDPLVGLLADRTRAWLRPQWLMSLGGILLLGGAWWLFRPGQDAGALYLFTALGVTYLGWTLLAIPYYALGAEIGDRGRQTMVAAWREAGMIAGTLAALILPAVLNGPSTLELSATALLWLAPPALAAAWMLRDARGADHRCRLGNCGQDVAGNESGITPGFGHSPAQCPGWRYRGHAVRDLCRRRHRAR